VNTEELKASLAATELFGRLPAQTLSRLAKSGREVAHADGHEVVTEGAGAVGFHLIVAGTARVTSKGAERRTLATGDYFGEISVIDGRPRSAGVEAVEGLRTFVIEPTVFRGLLDSNPAFARDVLVMLCTRLRAAESQIN
jgi:CRP/FNR family cyclic AMP-dependent transcriptional regulator